MPADSLSVVDKDGEETTVPLAEIPFVYASGTETVASTAPEEPLLPAPEVGTFLAPDEFEVQYS